jgi:hypothetical protein
MSTAPHCSSYMPMRIVCPGSSRNTAYPCPGSRGYTRHLPGVGAAPSECVRVVNAARNKHECISGLWYICRTREWRYSIGVSVHGRKIHLDLDDAALQDMTWPE